MFKESYHIPTSKIYSSIFSFKQFKALSMVFQVLSHLCLNYGYVVKELNFIFLSIWLTNFCCSFCFLSSKSKWHICVALFLGSLFHSICQFACPVYTCCTVSIAITQNKSLDLVKVFLLLYFSSSEI